MNGTREETEEIDFRFIVRAMSVYNAFFGLFVVVLISMGIGTAFETLSRIQNRIIELNRGKQRLLGIYHSRFQVETPKS